MKKFGIMILCAAVAIISVFFSYRMMKIDDNEELTAENIYSMARDAGYQGTFEEFVNQFKGDIGERGERGEDGEDGKGIKSAEINSDGHLILTYTDSTVADVGLVVSKSDYSNIIPVIGDNGNWFIDGVDTGVKAEAESSEVMSKNSISKTLLSSVSIRSMVNPTTVASGSGIIYKLDKEAGSAYIITNYHVMYDDKTSDIFDDGDTRVFLYGMESEKYGIPAKYVGGSAVYDIAVIKVEDSDVLKNSNAMEASIADSDVISVLDDIVAVGNALSVGMSATRGFVNVESEYVSLTVGGITSMMRVVRIDAAVNKGNSGGGMFNTSGEVVGIVNSKEVREGVDNMAYAIPINLAVSVADNIIYYCDGTAKVNGRKVLLGMAPDAESSYTVYDKESGKLLKRDKVVIKNVVAGSLAEASGMMAGDIVTSVIIDGIEYEVNRSYQLAETALFVRPGSTLQYKIIRLGESMTVDFTFSEENFVNID
jgi:serine protease Do